MKENNDLATRFYCFSSNSRYYIYDKFQNALNKIPQEIFLAINENNFNSVK